MIFTTLDNFYVSKEDLADSPSRKDGISADTERDQRIYGCELIQEAGILLRLPQAVMATGQVLLHRFYCKVSLVAHDVKVGVAPTLILLLHICFVTDKFVACSQKTAMACVWLATKLEENPRRMREMLSVFYRLDRRRQGKPTLPPLDVYGPVSPHQAHLLASTSLAMLPKGIFVPNFQSEDCAQSLFGLFAGL